MQLEAERSADRSGDAPVAGSVRGALAASLSRAPFEMRPHHGPESLRGRHFRRRGAAATASGTSFPSNGIVSAKSALSCQLAAAYAGPASRLAFHENALQIRS